MSWSTRELADLAGTTMNTVRHYHAIGLLDEPDRRYNGYKQYDTHHLVRLLQLRRLVQLGLPLAQIGEAAGAGATDALLRNDSELQKKIASYEQSRLDIAEILRAGAPVDTPHGFEAVGAQLTEADRSLIHICTRTHSPDALSRLRLMVIAEPPEVRDRLGALRPGSSDDTLCCLAGDLVHSGSHWRSTGWLGPAGAAESAPRLSRASEQTFAQAVGALYTFEQQEVLSRADALMRNHVKSPPSARDGRNADLLRV